MIVSVHEDIVRDALGGGHSMSARALGRVIIANKLSDLYQLSPERHFDNAPDRRTLCDRWEHGLKRFLDLAVERGVPEQNAGNVPRNRKGALHALGAATHALADFYAHTNWTELHVAQGQVQTLAPLLGETCDEDRFPTELQSGYFSLRYGLCGCPKKRGELKPPVGYRYCHEQIAKDHPQKGHGGERVNGTTYHQLAVEQATRATHQLWDVWCQRIRDRCTLMAVNAEGVLAQLCWDD
jgi:hypothetical protein